MARQVHCVNKRDRQDPYERILHIGGVEGGTRWKRSQTDAIADVERDARSYYVARPQHNDTVWVIVRVSRFGNKYLTTEADGESQNNLLSLPECP
jgi:hypothetical protein